MTEYEAASLALQQDSLMLLQSTLALEQASLAVQRASVWVAAIVGAAQCSVVGYGLFVLHRDYNRRAEQHRKNMKAIEGRQESQNAQHRENMAALENRHQETMKGLEGQQSALMELIRRTSAPSATQDS